MRAPGGLRTIPIALAPGRDLRVLLAEDNAVLQAATRALLTSRWRIDLTMVDDGAQAVAAAVSTEFDLVLMDLQMPVVNGFDATLGIRHFEARNPERRRTPVVAFTSSDPSLIVTQLKAAGIDALLAKPCQPQAMCRVLHRWATAQPARLHLAGCDSECPAPGAA